MSALLIAACLLTQGAQNIFTKEFNKRCKGGAFTYSAIKCVFALLFFVVATPNIRFSSEILPYSIAFACVYTVATFSTILAIKTGSLAISALIISYSLIIPTLYGLIFLNEGLGVPKMIGIGLLCVSLFLVRGESDRTDGKNKKKKKFSGRWLIYIIVAFVTNGLCSTIQNMQQKHFDGAENGNYMVLSLIISVAALIVLSIVFERGELKKTLKSGTLFGAAEGICNGALNLLVMITIALVASSVFFPVISAGGIVITFCISVFIYKENFIPRQLVGIALGLGSIILLNL